MRGQPLLKPGHHGLDHRRAVRIAQLRRRCNFGGVRPRGGAGQAVVDPGGVGDIFDQGPDRPDPRRRFGALAQQGFPQRKSPVGSADLGKHQTRIIASPAVARVDLQPADQHLLGLRRHGPPCGTDHKLDQRRQILCRHRPLLQAHHNLLRLSGSAEIVQRRFVLRQKRMPQQIIRPRHQGGTQLVDHRDQFGITVCGQDIGRLSGFSLILRGTVPVSLIRDGKAG